MKRRADDILAYLDHNRTSNGLIEAINGRTEHLRGTTLGLCSILHYITQARLDTGGSRTKRHSFLR